METTTRPGMEPNSTQVGKDNGARGKPTQGTNAEDARRQAFERAEELADQWAEQISQYTATLGQNILKWASRAREEAEDIWAEAQAIRERQRR
jgi:hypothetical protein